MTPKQSQVRQAIENLRLHMQMQTGLDYLVYTLKLFDEMILELQPNNSPELNKQFEPPTVLKVGTSTVDKLTGIFPEKRDGN